MKKHLPKLLLMLPLVLLFIRCSDKEKTSPTVKSKVWLENGNSSFTTYQRATLMADPGDLSNTQYAATFAGEKVTLEKNLRQHAQLFYS